MKNKVEKVVYDCNKKTTRQDGNRIRIERNVWFCNSRVVKLATADRAKYPVNYHKTIWSQRRIRWQHMFAGKLSSQEWLYLPEERTNTTTTRKQDSYTWGASIVQILLSQYIVLWELRNKEVHRKTKEHQE